MRNIFIPRLISLKLGLCLAFAPIAVLADSGVENDWDQNNPVKTSPQGQEQVQAAQTVLPVRVPGEEVSDGKGTSKLWTTSGPVPVHEPSTIGQPSNSPEVQPSIGVYVVLDKDNKVK